jgi:hypothetical protein
LNFMALICLDYIYRDRHGSNAIAIIRKANEIFYKERQQLDFLFVIQSNPKPEHRVFVDTTVGFYGEHLVFAPGVKYGATLFLNSSGETLIEGVTSGTFGYSSIVVHKDRRLPSTAVQGFASAQRPAFTLSSWHFFTRETPAPRVAPSRSWAFFVGRRRSGVSCKGRRSSRDHLGNKNCTGGVTLVTLLERAHLRATSATRGSIGKNKADEEG